MTLHDEVVAEEYKHIDLPFRYHRSYLEIASERSAQQAVYFQLIRLSSKDFQESLLYQPTRGPGTEQSTLAEGFGIEFYPTHQFRLA